MEKNEQEEKPFFHVGRLYRFWYYFRIGLTHYIGLPISAFNMAFLIYIMLLNINPSFSSYAYFFVTTMAAIILISGMSFGLFHFKKAQVYAEEMNVLILNNPWYYKAMPGKSKEIFIPCLNFTLKGLKRLSEKSLDLTSEESELINFLLDEGNYLLEGGLIKEPFIKGKRKLLMDKIQSSLDSTI